MANAFKCDRCGAFFNGSNNDKYPKVASKFNDYAAFSYHDFYDLCDKCREDLEKFMQNCPVVGPNEAVYTLYADGVPYHQEQRVMTCREKLAMEHPEYVGIEFMGGCCGCPHHYGYARRLESCEPGLTPSDEKCTKCWGRPVETKENE